MAILSRPKERMPRSRRKNEKKQGRRPVGTYSLRRRSYSRARCNKLLAAQIRENMKQYKAGRWSSRNQAIAVAIKMVEKKHPQCRRFRRK